ncbi:MFS transporter [Caulobacter sp. Root655]|uniref:MFS transporter n=1 Tax=Caulobacter sp. Root655 TaxID=1736578 RepID=UPI0006F208DB|nr:MFS transporter [Caulobacter sp. Root655]KRA66076.1 MFS transporter [Caulobacter sp. Root655]
MSEFSAAAAVPQGERGAEGEPIAPLKSSLPRGALAWILQQGARDPYVILITIYIFSPYFSRVLVGDPVKGQALIANISTTYGLLTALTAPLLGAMIEQYGPRKPMLGIVLGVMVPALLGLWWAMPADGLPLVAVSALLIVLGLVYNWGDVLSNSLLGRAAGAVPGRAALISGLGYALANGLSVALLVFMLWGMVLPGQVDWPGVPHAPLFGLDASKNEPSRISGPLAAAVMLVGAIPFFLWTPDAARTGRSWMASMRAGIAMLRDIFANLRGHRDVATYLAARMLYNDGMTALLVFGGLLAAGLMGWGALEMLAYGISLSIFGVFGGLIAPWFDRTLGPRKAVQLEIAGSLLVLIATLGMGRDKILYFWSYDPAAHAPIWNGPLFRTAPELIYLGLGLLIAVFVTAQYASSRTLLIRLAPPEKTAAFFGLYALSGTATVWLGSLLVALATAIFKSQIGGFLPIAGLLLLGFLGLFLVKGGERET